MWSSTCTHCAIASDTQVKYLGTGLVDVCASANIIFYVRGCSPVPTYIGTHNETGRGVD